jgi:glycerol kinase
MLFDIHTMQWDDDLLQMLNVPASLLPAVRDSSEIYGDVSTSLGLAAAPIAGIAGDQQAALFGQMCVAPGMSKNTYGTGCFLLQNTGTTAAVSRNRLVSTVAWRIKGRTEYALEGSIFIGGAVVQWLRDGLKVIDSAPEVEALAASVPDNGDVYLVPAFAGLGAPHWDPYARGAIIGLTRGTNAGHLARAALESVAYQVNDILEAIHGDSGIPLRELRVDGGAAGNDLLMQFQADLLGVPVLRPAITETTALGAAYLAGLAVGFWSSVDEVSGQWRTAKQFDPSMSRAEARRKRDRWREALERSRGWALPDGGT